MPRGCHSESFRGRIRLAPPPATRLVLPLRTRHCIVVVMLIFTLLLGISAIDKTVSRSLPVAAQPSDEELVISVKTSRKFHTNRVKEIAETWFQDSPNNVYFFTDGPDNELNETLRGHLLNSQCPSGHTRSALCCKMNAELEFFVAHDARWSCHFDDDNYVNVATLRKALVGFDYHQEFYLGRPSTAMPIHTTINGNLVKFWFATGGAGICLSRTVVRRLRPYVENGGFKTLGEQLKLPDDVTLGYLVGELLSVKLTVLKNLHSHLEDLGAIREHELAQQISTSAGEMMTSHGIKKRNVVNLPRRAALVEDPMRFRAIHCHLHPNLC